MVEETLRSAIKVEHKLVETTDMTAGKGYGPKRMRKESGGGTGQEQRDTRECYRCR